MDSLRSPTNSTSPRPRPGGPRRPTTYKTTTNGHSGFPSTSDEAAPSYSGRNSPAYSSHSGSVASPVTSSFEQHTASSPMLSQAASTIFREEPLRTPPVDAPTTSPSITRASTPGVKVLLKPPTLTPPPPLNFESVPIAWRGMTLESAQYNMTSGQLQEIVSRAIRRTAQESFIRLLPVKVLDEELTAEVERLETLKATTQSQYRFNMHRRTMLLQSVLALSSGDGDASAIASLAPQLAEVTAACDKQMLELLRVADHKAQIQRLQDVHVSSALAMALRKLNSSYAKRTGELREAREQIEQLKAELEEAWKVAQDMAQEMDDLDNFHSGFSSESDADDDDEQRIDESVRLAEVIGITGKAVAMKATLTQLAENSVMQREREMENRTQKVSAAKKRSSRASKASLRLPKASIRGAVLPDYASGSSRSRSNSVRRRSIDDSALSPPPVPTLQVDTAALKKGPKDDSFLEMAETRPVTPTTPIAPDSIPPVPSLAAINHTNDPPRRDASSIQSKHSTLDFEIPPITISPAEDDSVSSNKIARRVHSLQPTTRRSEDTPSTSSGSSLRRAASDYRKFDGWPFAGSSKKNARRLSMPLTGTSSESSAPEGTPSPVERSSVIFPSRVFSPPPSSPMGP